VELDKVLGCELTWEVHIHSYWSQVRRGNGTAYESEEAYFREVLRLTSWRTAYKRLAVGRVLTSLGGLFPRLDPTIAPLSAVDVAATCVR
jgi:hypothetical protein